MKGNNALKILLLFLISLKQVISISTIKLRLSNISTNSYIQYDNERDELSASFGQDQLIILKTVTRNFLDFCNLSKFETKLSRCYKHVDSLDFSNNDLNEFPSAITDLWFENLQTLNLSGNSIKSFESFQNLKSRQTLQNLDLTGNGLTSIPASTFKNLPAIRKLQIAKNKISFIDSFSFANYLRDLTELDLSENLIEDNSIEFLLFASLPNLKVLNLDNNKLTMFSRQLIIKLYSLERLSLKANLLKNFEIFQITSNNKILKFIDLSFNSNLKFKTSDINSKLYSKNKEVEFLSYQSLLSDKTNVINRGLTLQSNKLENLNLAGVDLEEKTNFFLENLFVRYQNLKLLNISMSKISSVRTFTWPKSLEIIDLSLNQIESFDCEQFRDVPTGSSLSNSNLAVNKVINLRELYLHGNQLSSFEQFIKGCSNILKGFHDIVNKQPLKIDIRNNLFQSIDSVHSSLDKTLHCQPKSMRSSLLLNGNPLVCNCKNDWWANMKTSYDSSLFYVKNNEFCISIDDYESLSCRSTSLQTEKEPLNFAKTLLDKNYHIKNEQPPVQIKFQPIRKNLIAPILICPYKNFCSSETCQCCEFDECDCAFKCPAQCTCARDYSRTFDIVNCTGVDLETLPKHFPVTTTNLQISYNNLKRIKPYDFFGRMNLAKVDMSFNNLGFIEEKSFYGLVKLDTLKLSNNQLQILLGHEFKHLKKLEILLLNNNRIQFVSNLTFTYLPMLKYLNLKSNNLRHLLDNRKYFRFNSKLISLHIDQPNNELIFSNNFKDIIKKVSQQKAKNTLISDDTDSYFHLIQLHSTDNKDLTLDFILCVFGRFQNSLHPRFVDTKPMFVHEKVQNNLFKTILIRNLKKFNNFCLKKTSLVANLNQAIKLRSEDTSKVVLNYDTLIWSSIAFIIIIILFSVLLSILIMKLHRNSKKQKPFGTPLITSKKDIYAITDNLPEKTQKSCFSSKFFTPLRKKLDKFLWQMYRNKTVYHQARTQEKNQPQESTVQLKKATSKLYKTESNINYYVPNQSIQAELNMSYNSNYTNSSGISANACPINTVKKRKKFDLFIVYNKLDCDLVHNIITPILRGKPYNFAIALQHRLKPDRYSSSTTSTTTTSLSSFTSLRQNQPKTKLQASSLTTSEYLDYIKSSSLVLFVLSKNLFGETEQNLSVQTPKRKKIAILADDISEKVAEQLLKPNKIFRGNFNVESMVFSFDSVSHNKKNQRNENSPYASNQCDLLYEFRGNLLKENELEIENINKKIQLFHNEIHF